MSKLGSLIAERSDEMVALRRQLHQRPELAFEERWTAGLVADRLSRAGLEVVTGVGGTGVVGTLEGATGGKTLIYRADIDALPIEERCETPQRSMNPGAMHA